ncbi:MAG: pilus assembly FimT family protein, partial [Candidatus Dojkabacteria bacterium]
MKAFTLIELLLVVALISVVTVAGFPIFTSFLNSSEVDATADIIRSSARRAQLNAQGSKQDSHWGILIAEPEITIYRGDNYASRVATDDLIAEFSQDVEVTGDLEINFEKVTGYPASSVTIT